MYSTFPTYPRHLLEHQHYTSCRRCLRFPGFPPLCVPIATHFLDVVLLLLYSLSDPEAPATAATSTLGALDLTVSPTSTTIETTRENTRPRPPRVPPPSLQTTVQATSEPLSSTIAKDHRVDDVVRKCVATLGAPAQPGSEESIRKVLGTWTAKTRSDADPATPTVSVN